MISSSFNENGNSNTIRVKIHHWYKGYDSEKINNFADGSVKMVFDATYGPSAADFGLSTMIFAELGEDGKLVADFCSMDLYSSQPSAHHDFWEALTK